uniref:Uncharacterized protein n=1 Tax=Bicosoecida sp. CB-2014 TaxID=1486930 RepID=A0A7S1CK06_9STRA|mmetsp:Transcript_3778/g.13984  ORF Transcript_3778/g.13984 Transcript_3778/m.13984 type:complete len:1233 (+) Transcript_3778:44-3742(+)
MSTRRASNASASGRRGSTARRGSNASATGGKEASGRRRSAARGAAPRRKSSAAAAAGGAVASGSSRRGSLVRRGSSQGGPAEASASSRRGSLARRGSSQGGPAGADDEDKPKRRFSGVVKKRRSSDVGGSGRRGSSVKLAPIDVGPGKSDAPTRPSGMGPGVGANKKPEGPTVVGELVGIVADMGFAASPKKRSVLPIPGLTGKGKGQTATIEEYDKRRGAGGMDDVRRARRQKRYDLDPDMPKEVRAMYELSDILKNPNGLHSHAEAATYLELFTELDLSGKWIRDSGLRLLGMIMDGNKTITTLILSRNDLSGGAIQDFCRQLRNTKVRHLDLKQNRLLSGGAVALAAELPKMRLKSLNLFRNSIGKKGIAALAVALRQNLTLHTLDLGSNKTLYGPHIEAMEDTVHLRSRTLTVSLVTGVISSARDTDMSLGCKRDGLQIAKYTDGRRLEARWRDGHITAGRMHYPNGDTFEIEEGGEDGVPAHGTYHMMLVAKQRWYVKLGVLIGASVSMVDFGTDVNVLVALLIAESWEFFGITAAIIAVAIAVTSIELLRNGRRWYAVLLQLISATALFDAIQMVRGSKQKVRSFDLHQKECMLGYASINQLKLTEALVESAPQSFIALVIGFSTAFSLPVLVSIALSLASLATSLTMSDKRSMEDFVRSEHTKELNMSYRSARFVFVLLYRLFEVATRALGVAMFAMTFGGTHFATFVGVLYASMYFYWFSPGVSFTKRFTDMVTKFRLIWFSMIAFPGTLNVCPAWIKKEERLDSWVFFTVRFIEEAALMGVVYFNDDFFLDDGAERVIPTLVKYGAAAVFALKYLLLPLYLWAVHSATQQSILELAKSIRVLGAFSTALGSGDVPSDGEGDDGSYDGSDGSTSSGKSGKKGKAKKKTKKKRKRSAAAEAKAMQAPMQFGDATGNASKVEPTVAGDSVEALSTFDGSGDTVVAGDGTGAAGASGAKPRPRRVSLTAWQTAGGDGSDGSTDGSPHTTDNRVHGFADSKQGAHGGHYNADGSWHDDGSDGSGEWHGHHHHHHPLAHDGSDGSWDATPHAYDAHGHGHGLDGSDGSWDAHHPMSPHAVDDHGHGGHDLEAGHGGGHHDATWGDHYAADGTHGHDHHGHYDAAAHHGEHHDATWDHQHAYGAGTAAAHDPHAAAWAAGEHHDDSHGHAAYDAHHGAHAAHGATWEAVHHDHAAHDAHAHGVGWDAAGGHDAVATVTVADVDGTQLEEL